MVRLEREGGATDDPPPPLHGCRTTRIFCLSTCHYDRRVLERNRVTFEDVAAAVAAGYRACKVCRPADQALR